MPKYLLLVICLVLGCGRQSAATLGAGLIPRDAATSPRSTPVTPAAAETSKGGPTPYPKDDCNWPGVGAIRVFEFMIPRRQDIWSQRLVNQGAVVFVGDSNVEAWTSLKGDFAPMHVANVGIGGDVSRGVLFRLKEDV